ncbi:MAG: 2-C-methyl-D-erythritol 4-phosphate cytidylyltransferase [Candidatus Lustribacter sp.]|jgi:2-C-methyl-D-erythritol 4-phosphate cytidylyltransferase
MIWGAVIVAAGRGSRFGRPKQLVELGGKPMLAWSIEVFASMPEISDIAIVTEREFIEDVQDVAIGLVRSASLVVVAGGADRQASAANGIAALPDHCAGILIHDGARPFVRPVDVRAGMRAVRPGVAALLATPVVDTIKVVGEGNKVLRTLDRATLWAAQTPQFATARDMRGAHAEAVRHDWPRATDDATLLERYGNDVVVVESPVENVKVTHPADLPRAEAIAQERDPIVIAEEDVFLVECFVEPRSVDAVLTELESRSAHIDGVDRDLPNAVAIRAYAGSDALRGFGRRLHALAGEDALFTTHLSHVVPRT